MYICAVWFSKNIFFNHNYNETNKKIKYFFFAFALNIAAVFEGIDNMDDFEIVFQAGKSLHKFHFKDSKT